MLRLNWDEAQFDRLYSTVRHDIDLLARNAVNAAGKIAVARAKQGPFKDNTRQLRSTISARNLGQRNRYWTVEIRAPMHYASYVEKGTPPHDIWPKAAHGLIGPVRKGQTRRAMGKGPHEYIVGRGIALRWKNASGQVFFARMVHHPGSKAYPFFEPALQSGWAYLEQFVARGFAGISLRLESNA